MATPPKYFVRARSGRNWMSLGGGGFETIEAAEAYAGASERFGAWVSRAKVGIFDHQRLVKERKPGEKDFTYVGVRPASSAPAGGRPTLTLVQGTGTEGKP